MPLLVDVLLTGLPASPSAVSWRFHTLCRSAEGLCSLDYLPCERICSRLHQIGMFWKPSKILCGADVGYHRREFAKRNLGS
jgi:hypothetical protein